MTIISVDDVPENVRIVDGEDSLLYRATKGIVTNTAKAGAAVIRNIGEATLWTSKNIGIPAVQKSLYGLGAATLGTADLFISSLFSAGRTMSYAEAYAEAGKKGVAINFLNGFRNPVAGLSQTAQKLYEKFPLVQRKPVEQVFNKKTMQFETRGGELKFTKAGYGVLGGTAMIANVFQAYVNYITRHMGAVDPNKVTATPDYSPQQYQVQSPDFAGATGDLVFALHANR